MIVELLITESSTSATNGSHISWSLAAVKTGTREVYKRENGLPDGEQTKLDLVFHIFDFCRENVFVNDT